MTTTVYLADLRHNYSGVLSNDCMPLCVGYLKAVMDRDVPEVSSRIFAYPDRLWAAMEDQVPDVLMLSNYMWNEALSLHFAKLLKQLHPESLVVMGGPNIAIEPDRQTAWVADHPEIDVYVLGEGDFLASEVVQQYLDAGASLERLRRRDLPSSIWRGPDGELRLDETRPRKRAVEEIPSPILAGLFDEFFDGKLAPMIETNRGCPFRCTFCVQGTGWYTKVNYFDTDRL
ncbi:MAG: hypothetical protein O7A09_08665, partial [Proteobacteria bacterium]|nr:hypothetical protein [Pseudomonadota bacterium]